MTDGNEESGVAIVLALGVPREAPEQLEIKTAMRPEQALLVLLRATEIMRRHALLEHIKAAQSSIVPANGVTVPPWQKP